MTHHANSHPAIERCRTPAMRKAWAFAAPRRRVQQGLAALSGTTALLLLQAAAAHAAPCLPISQPLIKVPELVSKNGVLRGTILLTDEQRRLIFRSPGAKPGQPGSFFDCQPQRVRAFYGVEAVPKVPPSPGGIIDPVPGPTLRARVGDIVQLTFLNHIDANRFPYSIDQGEKRTSAIVDPFTGCDVSSPGNPQQGYPQGGGDTFPDCFHGSSTGNIHFHGTHTNPDSTGDNVLLEIRPSPRDKPRDGKPVITAGTVRKPFEAFFKTCEAMLKGDVFSTYPKTWDDAPLGPWTTAGTWTAEQAKLLMAYDAKTNQDLWDSNKKVIDKKRWPQYYIGAYPYCFQVPLYKEANFPPSPGGLRMGQAPGTHWYHAHKHGSTAINVANGMTGVFIIEGSYDDDLNKFYGAGWARTQPVMVINQLGVSPNLLRAGGLTDKGPDFTVNGRFQPIVDMAPGEVQLWRIANTSGRSGAYFGGFAPGIQWKQIAQDGVQFHNDNYQASLNKPFLLATGNRADILVKAPPSRHLPGPCAARRGSVRSAIGLAGRAAASPRAKRRSAATGPRSQFIPTAPKQPAFLTNITNQEVGDTLNKPREITFKTTPGSGYTMHFINNQKFSENNDPIAVDLNAVEEWKIINETFGPPISHPFHIHINPFQIVEVFDPNATAVNSRGRTVPKYILAKPDPVNESVQCQIVLDDKTTWKDCHADTSDKPRVWWDVFPIPTGRTIQNVNIPGHFRMRSRFVDFGGRYVLHCHILAHEDRGMMAIVHVKRPSEAAEPGLFKHH